MGATCSVSLLRSRRMCFRCFIRASNAYKTKRINVTWRKFKKCKIFVSPPFLFAKRFVVRDKNKAFDQEFHTGYHFHLSRKDGFHVELARKLLLSCFSPTAFA